MSENIAVGQKWHLKRQPHKVAVVMEVWLDSADYFGGHVRLRRPWCKSPCGYLSLDAFTAYYARTPEDR